MQMGGVIHNGSRYQFELVTWNDASDPLLVGLLYKTMAESDNITIFLGPYSSTLKCVQRRRFSFFYFFVSLVPLPQLNECSSLVALRTTAPYGIPYLIVGGTDPRLFLGYVYDAALRTSRSCSWNHSVGLLLQASKSNLPCVNALVAAGVRTASIVNYNDVQRALLRECVANYSPLRRPYKSLHATRLRMRSSR